MKKEEYQKIVDEMTWSFSRLNYSCEFCWLQNYILKNKEESKGNCFSDYGLIFHDDICEQYLKGNILLWQLEGIYKDKFSEIGDFPPNKYVVLKDKYYKEGFEFLKKEFDFLEKYDIIAIEEKCETTLPSGKPFIGYIDLILKDKDDNYIVWDWKSKAKFKSISERNDYARQLYMYSKHVKEKYNKYPKQLVFYHLRTQKQTIIPFDKEMYNEAFEWAENQIKTLRNMEEFNVTESYFFGRYLCNYRDMDGHQKDNSIKLSDVKV